MIQLNSTFDLRRDVISGILKKEETVRATADVSDPRILSVERDGGVLYCWRGETGTTRIGKYDPHSKHNKLLYTFDKQVCVSSCSLNKEETLLAVSLTQKHRPVSKCLTLLIEIHPINNTKVLKAVDCRVRVQFLYPHSVQSSVLESHLLLITEDGYVDQFHVMLARHEGYRVVMLNPDRLAKDRVVEEFSWIQWDSHDQRLYYITCKERHMLKCVQFYSQRNCETVFELPLDLPSNPFISVSFVHLGFDHYHEDGRGDKGISLVVFTDKTERSMCVCYSHPVSGWKEVRYTIAFVHKGCSKTFNVALDQEALSRNTHTHLQPLFFCTGYYVVVFLAGHFLHLLNTRQQDLLCYSFFLSGSDACLGILGGASVVGTQDAASLLDIQMGRIYMASISPAHLLELLRAECPEAQRLATLQCMLVLKGSDPEVERQVIDWIGDSVLSFEAFDQIQEFILASLYRITHQQSLSLDMVLPYSSVFEKKELPVALTMIPGVKCTPDLLPQPLFKRKGRNAQGFWAELQSVCERVKYFETVQSPRFRTSHMQNTMQTGLSSEKRRVFHQQHLEENTKKVLSMMDTWRLDRRIVPLFQEEDPQQKALIGLMVDKLREHLNRHLPQLGKKRIDALVVNYVTKLLEQVHHMLEMLWHKYKLGPQVLCLKQKASAEEWSVFHVMLRILEATKGLGLPLPPGYNSLLSVLGVKCVSHHSFLQFVDHGLLQLTEPFVSRIMKDLDNSNVNEALKFSILKRLPEAMLQRVCHLWDHPVSSACISREYVRNRLQNRDKSTGLPFDDHEHSSLWPDFLPLSYLTKVLSSLEEKALNPFEEQENIDARFVEETALKQTLIQLGLEDK
ncbi:gamma-secretase-activating protein isoform X1 [Alosa alosa]|uniref:gamma-secretase-activating protein isoform X1 n=1 Tax=Alosa alosa TaxID=278164 RepID=UPI0020154E60|nr:gamma-secretase-activating protein isoform X1 [Alosa alosa]